MHENHWHCWEGYPAYNVAKHGNPQCPFVLRGFQQQVLLNHGTSLQIHSIPHHHLSGKPVINGSLGFKGKEGGRLLCEADEEGFLCSV